MPRARIVLISIVLAAAGTDGYWLSNATDTPPQADPAQPAEPVANREAVAGVREQLPPAAPANAGPVATAGVRDEAAD